MLSGDFMRRYSRKPEIMADAAYAILIQDPRIVTGNFFIDDEVLRKYGVTDIDQYASDPAYKDEIASDFFVGDPSDYAKLINRKHKL